MTSLNLKLWILYKRVLSIEPCGRPHHTRWETSWSHKFILTERSVRVLIIKLDKLIGSCNAFNSFCKTNNTTHQAALTSRKTAMGDWLLEKYKQSSDIKILKQTNVLLSFLKAYWDSYNIIIYDFLLGVPLFSLKLKAKLWDGRKKHLIVFYLILEMAIPTVPFIEWPNAAWFCHFGVRYFVILRHCVLVCTYQKISNRLLENVIKHT